MSNEQTPAVLPPSAGDRSAPVVPSVAGRVVIGLLLLGFAGVTALFGPLLVMAGDNCFEGDARAICSPGGQRTVGALPLAAGFAAAVLTVAGLSSRRRTGGICLAAAVVLPALAWGVSLAIVGA
ncbi:hypothetical protein [Streptomyces pinistramenti]|uniref:hypothetical protein n=1 Tax=Streptomyces pinistramenti TaxID=2884812 RepID=UPI001D086B7B|nr:hypothetical protein [Streptomyces pinistramenti]MCB5907621.1 hypothetical protein [Streptomyces pinistramenti]